MNRKPHMSRTGTGAESEQNELQIPWFIVSGLLTLMGIGLAVDRVGSLITAKFELTVN